MVIVGWKNSGKTFFAQKIIEKLKKEKFNVASIKHAHHDFEIDKPGTDSYLHRQAGSDQVLISSSKRWVKITELNKSSEKSLNYLIDQLENPDIVIVEGFKEESHPKIEIIKNSLNTDDFMFRYLKNVEAIITDTKIESFKKNQFKRKEIDEIVSYILNFKK